RIDAAEDVRPPLATILSFTPAPELDKSKRTTPPPRSRFPPIALLKVRVPIELGEPLAPPVMIPVVWLTLEAMTVPTPCSVLPAPREICPRGDKSRIALEAFTA